MPSRRATVWISQHWLLAVNVFMGLFVGLPWLAPVFMHLGWTSVAQVIYLLYAIQCHQLPQRSYFLFGSQFTYSLAEVQAAWQDTLNPLILRQFIGNAQMGWKVAWSDRMVAMYTSMWLGGLAFAFLQHRPRWKPLRLWAFALTTLPMAIDGGTHFISDLAGLGRGFRDTNAWLAALTNSAWPATFYAGDQLGSFNAWMRLFTGAVFGLGLVGLMLPYLNDAFAELTHGIKAHVQTPTDPY